MLVRRRSTTAGVRPGRPGIRGSGDPGIRGSGARGPGARGPGGVGDVSDRSWTFGSGAEISVLARLCEAPYGWGRPRRAWYREGHAGEPARSTPHGTMVDMPHTDRPELGEYLRR